MAELILKRDGLHTRTGRTKKASGRWNLPTAAKGERWHLDGYWLERQDFRLFKPARMKEVDDKSMKSAELTGFSNIKRN